VQTLVIVASKQEHKRPFMASSLEFQSHSEEKFRHFLKSIVHQPATSNISFILSQRHLQGWPSKLRCCSSRVESLTVFLTQQTTWRTLSSLRCQLDVLITKFPEFYGTHKFLSPVFRSRVEFFLHNVSFHLVHLCEVHTISGFTI
jgi:hypothetical protein